MRTLQHQLQDIADWIDGIGLDPKPTAEQFNGYEVKILYDRRHLSFRTVAEGSLMRFREGSRQVQVKWRSMTGREGESSRLEGVELTLPYVAESRSATATITAKEALYTPTPLRLSFRGSVKLTTDDGLELDSETLKYWGPEARAFTRDPVRFRRGATSGSADGLEYTPEKGLWLGGHVLVRLPWGMLGVLGPMRMSYSKTIPTVRYVAGLLSDLVTDTFTSENNG